MMSSRDYKRKRSESEEGSIENRLDERGFRPKYNSENTDDPDERRIVDSDCRRNSSDRDDKRRHRKHRKERSGKESKKEKSRKRDKKHDDKRHDKKSHHRHHSHKKKSKSDVSSSSSSSSGSSSSSDSNDSSSDDDGPRSIITGKRIKMHIQKSAADLLNEHKRAALRQHMNSQY